MSGTLHVTRPEAHLVLVEIDHPPRNALGTALRARFLEALDATEADPGVRAVVVTGRGEAFCSGDDLREAQQRGGEDPAALAQFGRLLDRVEGFRAPVVAAVNGWCVGGGLELALCCDLRVASTEARFVCAGVNVGLVASAWRLPRLIGVARAKALLLTGSPCDAATAEHYGLVTAVHAPDALLPEALALAGRIASRAPLSVEATKRIASRAPDLSAAEAREAQARELLQLVRTRDHGAAVEAFVTKREPTFTRS